MQNMYTECTDCEKSLTDEDIKINREYGNMYYTVCASCVERYVNRILDIMSEE